MQKNPKNVLSLLFSQVKYEVEKHPVKSKVNTPYKQFFSALVATSKSYHLILEPWDANASIPVLLILPDLYSFYSYNPEP